MKMMKLLTLMFLMSFVIYSCKDELVEGRGKRTKIGFESTSFEVPKEGGLTLVVGKESEGWSIRGCYEIIDGKKIFIRAGGYVINGVEHPTDTVYGDWYTLYKKQNVLAVVLSPNTEDTERTFWIDCHGPYILRDTITIKQK